jgi:hypothetical protein
MKKSLLLAALVTVLAYAVPFVVGLASFSFNVVHLPAIIAGIFACGLVLFAFQDYSRKPRFRGYSARKATRQIATPAPSSEVDAASLWTYTTLSA